MCREIKFRAWDKFNKKMHNTRIIHFGYNIITDAKEPLAIDIDDVVFMQYTGLKDKDGFEIYEGDIVISNFIHDDGDVSSYEIVIKDIRYLDRDMLNKGSNNMELTVIGNIYENKDLLNKDIDE